MLNLTRRTLEVASSFDEQNKIPSNPGPTYLLTNALAITLATYVFSFRMLNVVRAAKEYDMRVPALHRITPGSAPPVTRRANRFAVIGATIVFLALVTILSVVAFTLEKPLSRRIFSSLMKFVYALAAFGGFSTVLGLCFPLLPGLSFLRLPIMGYAYPIFARPTHARSLRNRVTIIALSAAAVYAAIYPSQWLISFAMIGLAINSAARMPPGIFWHTLSLRGVVIATIAYFAMVVSVIFIIVLGAAKPRESEERDASDIDLDTILDPLWRSAVLIYQGIFIGALLTALVLRYEYSASTSASESQVPDDSEIALLAEMEQAAPIASYSVKEAIAARVAIPHNRPRFPRPLFYIFLSGVFTIHLPAIVSSTLSPYESGSLDGEKRSLLGSLAWFSLVLPAQIWTSGLFPAMIGIACLVRKDGMALWMYHEAQVRPLAGAPPTIEGDDATNAMEADYKAKSQLLDEGLSEEYPF